MLAARAQSGDAPLGESALDYPLSFGQRALWFLQQIAPDSVAYNIVYAVRSRGQLNLAAMERAFQRLVDRHPVLRSTFAVRDGEPMQRVHATLTVSLDAQNAAGWSAERLDAAIRATVYRPFDLAQGPLIRLHTFSQSPDDHLLVIGLHHIVSDLWSMAIVANELTLFYAAEVGWRDVSLKPLGATYADFVQQQAGLLAGPEGERLWTFWKEQLAGELPTLELPTDHPRPPVPSHRGATIARDLDPDLTARLRQIADAHGSTPFATLLTAFGVLLHRYTGQTDVLIGSPRANRTAKFSRVAGYYVNPVVVRNNLVGDPAFTDLLVKSDRVTREAFAHGDYPFPLLVERLDPVRGIDQSPIFQVMFAWQKTTRVVKQQDMSAMAIGQSNRAMDLNGLDFESVLLPHRVAPFDLTLLVAESGEQLAVAAEYATDLFDASTIDRLLGHYETLLRGIVANPTSRLSQLPLLSQTELHTILAEWNEPPSAESPAQSVCTSIAGSAARYPDAIAVECEGESLTYYQLESRANQLSRYLRRLGAGAETPIGVYVERSVTAVVALLGVLKSGAAYLPLDPSYPSERIAFMLEDTSAPVVVTQSSLRNSLPRTSAQLVCLDADWPAIQCESSARLGHSPSRADLAYVIYTSGSSGTPKGVQIEHGTIADHCRDVSRLYGLTSDDVVLQFASFNFDPSLEQTLAPLIVGARVVMRGREIWPPADFHRRVAEHGLTVINPPTAYWHELTEEWARHPDRVPRNPLRLIIAGGEAMRPESARVWHEVGPRDVRLLNAYGPTEATITATTYEVPTRLTGGRGAATDSERSMDRRPDDAAAWTARATQTLESVPIGRPLHRRRAYILDPERHPVPIGVPGELFLGGDGLARGYLNRAELTWERFIPDPFSNEPGARMYRTGDIARYRLDGNIEYCGRIDQQIKIRGYRVELGEIETALRSISEIDQALVIAQDDRSGQKRLVAYLVLSGEPQSGASNQLDAFPERTLVTDSVSLGVSLRALLAQKLPDYMVPSAFVPLSSLPLTPSGKLDRRALPMPDVVDRQLASRYVAPRTPTEDRITRIWAQLLGVERVGIHDDFFALGGHSLLAARLTSRLRDAFDVDLPLRRVFENPTPAMLAVALAQEQAEQMDEDAEQFLREIETLSDEEAAVRLAGEGVAVWRGANAK